MDFERWNKEVQHEFYRLTNEQLTSAVKIENPPGEWLQTQYVQGTPPHHTAHALAWLEGFDVPDPESLPS